MYCDYYIIYIRRNNNHTNECTQAVCNIILSLFIVLHTKQYALLTMYTLRYRTSENPQALRAIEFHLHEAALEHAVMLHYTGIRGKYQYWDVTIDWQQFDREKAEIIFFRHRLLYNLFQINLNDNKCVQDHT